MLEAKVVKYLKEQCILCLQQTGEMPSKEDIVGHIDSGDFAELFGEEAQMRMLEITDELLELLFS